ncbi:MAG: NUDIX domain-containing protein [Elainella sp. Prado103]|jgi:ADP-ribose pyrophosphatase YjhB (NUDIX family)|nr:NUDIX domain-containing protein [Elainella sp. Prado103]
MDDFHPLSAKISAAFQRLHQAQSSEPSSQSRSDQPNMKAIRAKTRRRGTALVDTDQGILLVSEDGSRFSLPGGAATRNELWIEAAIRELREETGLRADSAQYLFSHMGEVRKRGSSYSRNHHKVFLVKAEGLPKPKQEIRALHFYQPGDPVKLTNSTQAILEKYYLLQSDRAQSGDGTGNSQK